MKSSPGASRGLELLAGFAKDGVIWIDKKVRLSCLDSDCSSHTSRIAPCLLNYAFCMVNPSDRTGADEHSSPNVASGIDAVENDEDADAKWDETDIEFETAPVKDDTSLHSTVTSTKTVILGRWICRLTDESEDQIQGTQMGAEGAQQGDLPAALRSGMPGPTARQCEQMAGIQLRRVQQQQQAISLLVSEKASLTSAVERLEHTEQGGLLWLYNTNQN